MRCEDRQPNACIRARVIPRQVVATVTMDEPLPRPEKITCAMSILSSTCRSRNDENYLRDTGKSTVSIGVKELKR